MVKVGLFGAGYLGKIHINKWESIDGATLTGFYEPNDEYATDITDTYPLPRFNNEDELIDACDAIHLVSPVSLHFNRCEKAIRKGKHVFVEKSIAHTVAEAQQLVKLVQESNVKLQVGQKERFNPAFLAAREYVSNPLLIKAHRHEPLNIHGINTDVILDLMIHDIDAVLSIVNSDVKHISATGVNVVSATPDIADVRIEFYNGCSANLTASRLGKKKVQVMHLYQRDAQVEIDFLHQSAELVTSKGVEIIHTSEKPATTTIANSDTAQTELQAFIKAIENNSRTAVNEIDGLHTLEVTHQVLHKINQSLSLT